MRLLRSALALVLSFSLGISPALAQAQSIRLSVPAKAGASAAAGSIFGAVPAGTARLGSFSPARPVSLPPALSAPSVASAITPVSAHAASAFPVSVARLAAVQSAAAKAVEGLARAGGDASSAKARVQFAALTDEPLSAPSAHGPSVPAGASGPRLHSPAKRAAYAAASGTTLPPRLSKPAAAQDDGDKAEPPSPAPKKAGITQVFKDPERNKAYWLYVAGYSVFLFGYELYVVGLPYLISAITRNSLKENRDARASNEETVNALIRSNRSLARIAHWISQAFSYALTPLFTRNTDRDGPGKWLSRSMFIRAAALAAVPGLFFATGLLSVSASLWLLVGIIAAHSFFQGISVTAEGAATTRLLGDAGITSEERTKANSILTFVAAIISIIAPAIAGQIALIGPIMGKDGVGGAVIYSIYAGAVALAGLIYALVKMFRGPSKAAARPDAAFAPRGLGGTLKDLWRSIKDGTRIVFKDRFLRTLLLLSMVSSLFSDPLVFNVLPEYIEGLVAKNPGSVGAIMGIPGVGWFLKSLTATPMGNFALMMVMASVGSIVAALLIKPLTRLFQKLGFKTEEALTVPFYVLAALEAPLFLLMIGTPTILGAVALYGLQSLVVGFMGIAISGLYQKNLGGQKDGDVNKILAAQSLLGIAAAIVSTYVYGFLLKDIAIGTALTIAAVATCVMALLHLAAPFLAFSKAARRPPSNPPQPPSDPGSAPPARLKPPSGDHHGPNSFLSTDL